MALLRLDRHRRDRPRFQPGEADRLTRHFAITVFAVVDPAQRATVMASSFAAALELVREGAMDLSQKEAFAPLYFRKSPPRAPMAADAPAVQ